MTTRTDTPASDSPLYCRHCGSRHLEAVAPERKSKPLNLPAEYTFLKPEEFGRAIRRSKSWVYQEIGTGRIPAVSLDGALRLRVSDCVKFIESITVGGAR